MGICELSEKEKKAINILKDMNDGFTFQDCRVCIEDNKYNEKTGICESRTCDYLNSITTVLNLIQKREQEINKLNNVIDKMAERLINYDIDEDICSKIKKPESEEDDCYLDVYFGSEVCKNCLKEYFMKEDK